VSPSKGLVAFETKLMELLLQVLREDVTASFAGSRVTSVIQLLCPDDRVELGPLVGAAAKFAMTKIFCSILLRCE